MTARASTACSSASAFACSIPPESEMSKLDRVRPKARSAGAGMLRERRSRGAEARDRHIRTAVHSPAGYVNLVRRPVIFSCKCHVCSARLVMQGRIKRIA